jgi:hypothetical protein
MVDNNPNTLGLKEVIDVFLCSEHSIFKRLFSAHCLGSRGPIDQIEALERRPRRCAPVMIASERAAFAVHGVPSGTVYRRLLDLGEAACLTLAGIHFTLGDRV